jgi:hypothetical protein
MSVPTEATTESDRLTRRQQWFVVSRWAEFDGESRTNLLRIVGIGVFYLIELASYHGLHMGGLSIDATSSHRYHVIVTALAAAWALIALATLFCLQAKIFSSALKYLTTGCDVVLLTMIVLVGDGARSAMLVGYFLILALATLRFRIRLVWFATALCWLGYLVVLGCCKWYAPAQRDLSVPRYEQLIMLAALALEGIILGQVVRQVSRIAADYARRIEQPKI